MYVGLISDTHGVFDAPFRDFLAPVDVLWHAGDFGGSIEFAEGLAAFKPLVGVYGNCDGQDIRRSYPQFQYIEEQGLRILMTHIGGSPGHYELHAHALIDSYRPDVFVCGHSHILKVMPDKTGNLLYINPGAAGLQGWQVFRTALRFRIEEGKLSEMEVFRIPRNAAVQSDGGNNTFTDGQDS